MAKTVQYWGTVNYQELPLTGRLVTWTPKQKQEVPDAIATLLLAAGVGFLLDNDNNGELAVYATDSSGNVTGLVGPGGVIPISSPLHVEAHTFPSLNAANLTTYSQFIAEVDSFCLNKSITKTDRGLCSDGVNRIYSYKYGSGPVKVLLMAGQHGAEVVGQFAAFTWFKEFVSSGAATFSALRRQVTVTYVPCVNPYGYNSSRLNANSIDLNRNWNFYWDKYVVVLPENAKGSAAFSEVEPNAIKTIIDAEGCTAFIDCHSQGAGYSANDLMVSPPNFYTLHNRHIFNAATDLWKQLYSGVFAEMVDPLVSEPTFVNWAAFYATSTLGKFNASSVLIECALDMGGSSNTNLTSATATKYGGFITSWIWMFLNSQSSNLQIPDHAWQMRRVNEAAATSIAIAGSMIDVTSFTSFTFDEAYPWPSGLPRSYMDCPMVLAGYLEVVADGYIQSAGTGEQRIDIGISLDGAAPANHALTSITVPATSGLRTGFQVSGKFEITTINATYVPRIALQMMRVGVTQTPFVKRARMSIRFVSNSMASKTPYF